MPSLRPRIQRIEGSLYAGDGPLPAQIEVHALHDAGKKVVLAIWGRRAGKTMCGARQAIRNIYGGITDLNIPRGWILVPSYGVGEHAMWEEFVNLVRDMHLALKVRQDTHTVLLKPPKGCKYPHYTVQLKTAEKPDLLRGVKLAWCIVDEGRDVKAAAIRTVQISLADGDGPLLICTTPKGKANYLYELYQEAEGNPRMARVHASTFENHHLPAAVIKQLQAEFPGEYAQQELYGHFVALSGLVYGEFDLDKHVIAESDVVMPREPHFTTGTDFGVKHPFANLFIMDAGHHYILVDEIYKEGLISDGWAREILANPYYQYVKERYSDRHDPKSRMELAKRGVQTVPAPPDEKLRFSKGIRLIKSLLRDHPECPTSCPYCAEKKKPKLLISSRCVNTIKEFGLYAWRESPTKNVEKPIQKWDDAMDALRYALMGRIFVGKADLSPRYMDGLQPQKGPRRVQIVSPSWDPSEESEMDPSQRWYEEL